MASKSTICTLVVFFVVYTAAQNYITGPIFQSNSCWQAKLPDNAPISVNTSVYVKNIYSQVNAYGPWINTGSFSVPMYVVPENQPNVYVTLNKPAGAPIIDQLQADWANVPVPVNAHPANGSDHHLVIWQPSTDKMWEFWVMKNQLNTTTNTWSWSSDWGGFLANVSKGTGFFGEPYPTWGATATSLLLAGGLMLISEAKAGLIPHALAFATLDYAPWYKYVAPAQRSDGDGHGVIPEGTRFRFPPDVNISAISNPFSKVMATAIRDYGLICRDTAGVPVTYAEDPSSYGGVNPWPAIFGDWENHIMQELPWMELQVVDPIWTPWDPTSEWYQAPN